MEIRITPKNGVIWSFTPPHLKLIQGMAKTWELVLDTILGTEPDSNKLIYVKQAWRKLYDYSPAITCWVFQWAHYKA